MADWTEHQEIFDIPDVTEECDEMQPATKWRMVQFGKPCHQECTKVRKKRSADWPQIVAIMRKLAKSGFIRNEEQYKHEFDDVYAIKSRRGIRALGFLQSDATKKAKPVFVVVSWFQKQRKSLSRQEVARVTNRRREFKDFIKEQCDEN